MPETITIEEAQAHLAELLARLAPGEEMVITKDERPVAKIVSQPGARREPRSPGSAKGKLFIQAEDDEHLADFKEFMP